MVCRCEWCVSDPIYRDYHDKEWSKPVKDDQTLFEFLILESAQAGLSWITILKKRDGYRKAFFEFDYNKVAEMTPEDEKRLNFCHTVYFTRSGRNKQGYEKERL